MFALALLSLAQAQPLPTVFGIQLGAPVSLRECKIKKLSFELPPGSPPNYDLDQPEVCAEQPMQLRDSPFQKAIVHFPPDQAPEIIVADMVGLYLWEGKVVAIEAETPNPDLAPSVIATLTTKFGKPSSTRYDNQYIDGNAVPSQHVVWQLPGATVDYWAISTWGIDSGALLVSMPAYDQIKSKDEKAKADKRVPL